jgi:hypothetical protein
MLDGDWSSDVCSSDLFKVSAASQGSQLGHMAQRMRRAS